MIFDTINKDISFNIYLQREQKLLYASNFYLIVDVEFLFYFELLEVTHVSVIMGVEKIVCLKSQGLIKCHRKAVKF